jgi:hypothetical protein
MNAGRGTMLHRCDARLDSENFKDWWFHDHGAVSNANVSSQSLIRQFRMTVEVSLTFE